MAASTTLSTVATVTNFTKLSTCHMQGITETTANTNSDTPLLVYWSSCWFIGDPINLFFWIWFDMLQGPLLVIITTEQGQRNNSNTLRGIICTVCCCTGLIKNWLIFLIWLPMCGRQPLVAICLLLMRMQ